MLDTKTQDRKTWLGLLARAPGDRLGELLAAVSKLPDFEWLRPPEIGSVMVRGRAGGTGAPFNLGEMTVTRCALSSPREKSAMATFREGARQPPKPLHWWML